MSGAALHTYESQFQGLEVLVSRYTQQAEESAARTADNLHLLAQCRQELGELQRMTDAQRGVLRDLDQAITALESRSGINEGLAERLKKGARAIPAYAAPPESLAAIGPFRSSDALLSDLLSQDELRELRNHLARPLFERLKWAKGDYLAVAVSLLIGLALDITNLAWRVHSPIDGDGRLRKWFDQALHNHSANNPIDYQGPGFGGELHRVRSRGHDLARFFEAVRQTAEGEFRGTRWSYGKPIKVIQHANQFGTTYPQVEWIAAFVDVSAHLFADFFSSHSLPLPLSSVVYDHCEREMRVFVHGLYEGGYNVRHIALNALEVALAYLALDVWLWMQYGNERSNQAPVLLKKYEMRTAIAAFLSGWNVGGCLLFQNPFYLNIPVLAAAVDSSVRMYSLSRQRNFRLRKEIRNIDEIYRSWDRLREDMEQERTSAPSAPTYLSIADV